MKTTEEKIPNRIDMTSIIKQVDDDIMTMIEYTPESGPYPEMAISYRGDDKETVAQVVLAAAVRAALAFGKSKNVAIVTYRKGEDVEAETRKICEMTLDYLVESGYMTEKARTERTKSTIWMNAYDDEGLNHLLHGLLYNDNFINEPDISLVFVPDIDVNDIDVFKRRIYDINHERKVKGYKELGVVMGITGKVVTPEKCFGRLSRVWWQYIKVGSDNLEKTKNRYPSRKTDSKTYETPCS